MGKSLNVQSLRFSDCFFCSSIYVNRHKCRVYTYACWHKLYTMMRNRLVMMSELVAELESEAMNCTLMTCHLATMWSYAGSPGDTYDLVPKFWLLPTPHPMHMTAFQVLSLRPALMDICNSTTSCDHSLCHFLLKTCIYFLFLAKPAHNKQLVHLTTLQSLNNCCKNSNKIG